MGFFLTQDPCQVSLKIPDATYQILNQDINDFWNIPEKEKMSSFLNRMIANFYFKAESSILTSENEKELRLKYLSPVSEETADLLINHYIEIKKVKIQSKYPYPKHGTGKQFKFMPNKEIQHLLENFQYSNIYDAASHYLSALIQEYASLPREQRECIFFDDIYRKINNCIQLHHEIEIKHNQGIYILRPYKILTDGVSPWHYIIGYAKEKHQKNIGTILYSFRMQRIESVKEQNLFEFAENEIKELEKIIKNPSQIPYLSGKIENIVVRLTPDGLNLYQNIIRTNQPKLNKKETKQPFKADKEGMYSLIFECTQQQAYLYFIKFGKDVEIVSPLTLRERFAELHKTAIKYYI